VLQIGANLPGGASITLSGGVPNAGGGGQLELNGSTISNNLFITYATTGPGAIGALINSSSTTAVINGNVQIGGNNYTGGSGNITINGVISGGVVNSGNDYAFYQQGTGVWKLANSANTFDGYYYIAGGMTQVTALANINQTSSLGQPTAVGTDQLVFNGTGGTLDYIGAAASTTDRNIVLNASHQVIAADGVGHAATLTITGNASGSSMAALVLSGANTGSNNFQGTISSGALTKNGAGVWILSGTNSYQGGTTVSDGTLILTNSGAVADGTSLTVGDGSLFVPAPSAPVPAVTPVPEPSALALLSAAAIAFGLYRRCK
jgi:fibronectin-binding autotransporter adhesin